MARSAPSSRSLSPARCRAWPLAALAAVALAGCDDAAPAPTGISLGGADGALAIDCVAVDPTGAIVVGGRFEGTVALTPTTTLVAVQQADGFLARLAPDGEVLWARGFGGLPAATNRDDRVTGVAIAPDGAIVVTGYVEGTVDLGGGPRPGSGAGALFIARYGADGGHQWSQRWPSVSFDSGASAPTIGDDGSIYVAARFTGGATIGDRTLSFATSEQVIVKLAGDGALQWARPLRRQPPTEFPGSYGATAPVVVGDAVYVSGAIAGAVDLGTGPLADSEGYATYVVELAADTGATRTVRGYAETEHPYGATQLVRTPDGGLALTGPQITWLAPDLTIARTVDLSDLTRFDAFDGRAAFRADGELAWISATAYVRLGADGQELARTTFAVGEVGLNDLAIGPDDRVVIVGGYRAGFDLAGATFAAPADGRTRGFIASIE